MDDQRIAIIVEPSLTLGLIANTIATIGIGLGAAEPGFGGVVLTDVAGRSIQTSADRPVPILQAPADVIRRLLMTALDAPAGGRVVAFPQFARALHSFPEYRAQFPARDLADEVIEGLGLAGPAKWVKSLTGSLKLLR
jgi:hypothetical protein